MLGFLVLLFSFYLVYGHPHLHSLHWGFLNLYFPLRSYSPELRAHFQISNCWRRHSCLKHGMSRTELILCTPSPNIGWFHIKVSFSWKIGKSYNTESMWLQLAGAEGLFTIPPPPFVRYLADFTQYVLGLATVDVWVCDHGLGHTIPYAELRNKSKNQIASLFSIQARITWFY